MDNKRNKRRKKKEDWEVRSLARVLAIAGPFKGRVFDGWFDFASGIFHLRKNNWCDNKGAFKVNCLKCGRCPLMSDVRKISKEISVKDAKTEIILEEMIGIRPLEILENLLSLGFKPQYRICFRIPLHGLNYYYKVLYLGKGNLKLVGKNKEGIFTKDIKLNTGFIRFRNNIPAVYGYEGTMSFRLSRFLTRQILVGLTREWYKLIKSSLKVLQESG